LTVSVSGTTLTDSRRATGLAADGRPGLVTGPRVGGAAAPSWDDRGETGDAVTGPGVEANPMTLASTITTRAVTATQA
jgi:hypothetical protein